MINTEVWNIRNQTHVVLSENAAEHYDNDYAANNYQTRQYMAYEEHLLMQAVGLTTGGGLAVELGCGTGRDLFKYAACFDKIYAWDFSPKMVQVTQRKAKVRGYDNIIVEERNVEQEGFASIDAGTVDFINAGFGMGSFIENLDVFLAKVNKVMSRNGIFMATFYNKNSIVQSLNNRCFAAIPDTQNNTLTVNMGGNDYVIPCIAYSVEELSAIFGRHFQIIKMFTYPTISTLLTDEVLAVSEIKSAILDLEDRVKECLWGHYIIVWCKKN